MADDDKPPSENFLPFGYNFNPSDGPVQNPPEPPPGAPLLSDQDSMLLSSFFEDMTADQYNMPSFGEGLNFSNAWLDLPPQFMGTATSFGQQPSPLDSASQSGPAGHHMSSQPPDFARTAPLSHMMPPPPPPQHSSPLRHLQNQYQPHLQQQEGQQQHPQHSQASTHHSDDVLSAAATLLQNGQGSQRNPQSTDYSFSRQSMGPPVGHLRHQPLDEFQEEGRKGLLKNQAHESSGPDWMYSGPGRRTATRSEVPTGFQFGTDSNFSPIQGYTPDANRETVESMHREQLKLLDGLEVSKSAANTRPSSPTDHQGSHVEHHPAVQSPPAPIPSIKEEDPEAPPRKRRKSKSAKEKPAHEDEASDKFVPKDKSKRKPKADSQGTERPTSTESGSGSTAVAKKRKPGANGVKSARENLSEEQKRENHIKSEQKRRTLIKEGFDDLCELIPGLRSGGFSKSAMLNIAGDWLEELLGGNEMLNKQLAELKQ